VSHTRYIKPCSSVYGPGCFVSVIVVGRPIPGTGSGGFEELVWDHGAACVSRWRSGKWSPMNAAVFTDGPALVDWVEGQSQPGKGTWVVSPNATHAVTLCGLLKKWEVLGVKWRDRRAFAAGAATNSPARGQCAEPPHESPRHSTGSIGTASPEYIVDTCITNGKPTIVRYSIGERRLCWVSGEQYYTASEAAIRKMLYPPGPDGTERPAEPGLEVDSALDRAVLWLRAMQRLADWWRKIEGGPWGTTIGKLSLNYYRHRLAPKTVLAHQVDRAREVEEKAVYGGKATTWFHGAVGKLPKRAADGSTRPPASPYEPLEGPLEHWDVASMYPTILAREVFPEHLLYVDDGVSLSKLRDAMSCRCVIADVTVRTDRPGLPMRDGERVVWPVGEWRTSLAGPELARAVELDQVVTVHRLCTYRGGRPFAPAAQSLLRLRQESRAVGEPVWEMLVKALSNAFGGKLAERRFEWVAQPRTVPLMSWGEWSNAPEDPERRQVWRAAVGLVWERSVPKHKGRPLASCFAYLTAYGRALMHELCGLIPGDQLVSMDTDGIWVRRPSGYLWQKVRKAALNRGYILRRVGGAAGGIWYDARHYWTDKGWVLSGYHEPKRVGRGLIFEDTSISIPPATVEEGAPTTIVQHTNRKPLHAARMRMNVDGDGWSRPIRVAAPSRPAEPHVPSGLLDTLHTL